MSTTVPIWPDVGLTDEMVLATRYTQPFTSVTREPLADSSTTSPTPGVPAPARTTTWLEFDETISTAGWPPRSTRCNSSPPPSSRWPVMVTRVPSCPTEGETLATSPSSKYVKPPTSSTTAPVSATSVMLAVPATLLPALSTAAVLFAAATAAGTPPIVACAIAAPPPRSRDPATVTSVPACPSLGVTLSMAPRCRNVKASWATVRPPADPSTVTFSAPADTGASGQTTTTTVSFPATTAATSSPSLTLDTPLAAPCSPVPVTVTLVPAWPDAGSTLLITPGAAYCHAFTDVTVAPLDATSATSPDAAPDAPALTTTSVAFARWIAASASASETEPRPAA